MVFFPPQITGICLLLAAIGGIFYGKGLRHSGLNISSRLSLSEVPLLGVCTLVLLLLVLPLIVARNYPLLYWHLPLHLQYYAGPAAWTFTLGYFTFIAATVGALKVPGNGAWLMLLPLALVLILAEIGVRLSPFQRPPVLAAPRDNQGVILQTSDATCAAAASANILRAFGRPATEAEMVEVLHTSAFGTSTGQLYRGLRKLGFQCIKRLIPDRDTSQLNPPAVLFVDFGSEPLGHVVTYMGMEGDRAIIFNPQGGKNMMTREALAGMWRGHALEVSEKPD